MLMWCHPAVSNLLITGQEVRGVALFTVGVVGGGNGWNDQWPGPVSTALSQSVDSTSGLLDMAYLALPTPVPSFR